MNAARLFDGKVPLIHRAKALRAEAQFLFQAHAGEHLGGARFGFAVKRRIDAVAFQDGEANLLQRPAQLAREGLLVGFAPAQEAADIAGLDARLLVERFLMAAFGQMIFLLLVHLVVVDEGLVGGVDALGFAVIHGVLMIALFRVWRRAWPSI